MNSSRLKFVLVVLTFSLALNLGLASLLRTRRAPVPTLTPAVPAHDPRTAEPGPRLPLPTRPRAIVEAGAPTDGFQWSSLESPDYKVYIANLRRIGCPEETIRDVIVADLNKSYLGRMNEVVTARARSIAYWKSDAGRNEQVRDLEKELREVNREKHAVIKELLGVDVATPATTVNAGKVLRDELAYGFLPPEKAATVRGLLQRYQDLERELVEKNGGRTTPEDRNAVRDLQRQRDAELAAALSPSELQDYQLRNSSSADVVRAKTQGMNLSEDDFRKLYAIRKSYDDASAQINPADLTPEQRQQLRLQRDDQIKSLLGNQRYTDYQRSQDLDYRSLNQIGERYKLPAEVVASAYDINRVAQEQMSQLLSDRTMDPARQKDALAAIRAATDQELKRTLGAQGFESFHSRGPMITVNENGEEVRVRASVSPDGTRITERRVPVVATPAAVSVTR